MTNSTKKTKKDFLHKDITREVFMGLAVFGLGFASLMATLGVAVLGVQTQVALAHYGAYTAETAAVLMGDNRATGNLPPPMPAHSMVDASSTPSVHKPEQVASSTPTGDCPHLSRPIARGDKDATTTGDISELQRFIAARYQLEASTTVTGYFGSTTQSYLERFQKEQGIPPAPSTGPLTRAAIAKFCGGLSDDKNGHRGSSTPVRGDIPHDIPRPGSNPQVGTSTIGSTTPAALPRPEHKDGIAPPPLPPLPPKTTISPNGAAAIEGLQEMGDGFGKIVSAYFSLFGI